LVLFPITPGVRRTSDTGGSVSPPPPLDKKRAEKTLKRDDFTCRFCGFRAQQFQRIIPYEKADDPPFATACGFCEQCLMLDRTGLSGSGILIWLPEISQIQLHHIMRAVYVARAAKGNLTAAATRTADALMARRAEAKKRLGSDDPLLLATVMQESLTDEEYEAAIEKTDGIRLFPLDKHMVRTAHGDINQFPQMLKFWCSVAGPYAKLPANQWAELFKTTASTVGHA
jgi:intracellular multiplication protein IcmJ